MNGIILQPDAWIGETPSVSITWGSDNTSWTQVLDVDWHELEEAGAVFLPITGRLGTNTDNITSLNTIGQSARGHYWTATNFSINNAYYFSFFSSGITSYENNTGNNQDKRFGCAVRLVRNVE